MAMQQSIADEALWAEGLSVWEHESVASGFQVTEDPGPPWSSVCYRSIVDLYSGEELEYCRRAGSAVARVPNGVFEAEED